MTDPDLVEKKLARIEDSVTELRRLARPQLIGSDLREESFILHRLQVAIQAAIDTAAHIIADERYGEPSSARDVFTILKRRGIVPAELGKSLEDMVSFRNVLVHQYDDIDLAIVQHIVAERLDDLLAFASLIRANILGR